MVVLRRTSEEQRSRFHCMFARREAIERNEKNGRGGPRTYRNSYNWYARTTYTLLVWKVCRTGRGGRFGAET